VTTDLYGPKYMPRISGYGDVAIVHFHLADASEEAFFVRCGAGLNPDICMLLDPKWPTDALPTVAP
jgi:hypothetical protein